MASAPNDQLALVRQLRDQNVQLASELQSLKGGGGGGTSGPVDTTDAKIAAAEARTDTKFAELRGDISSQSGEIKAELAKKPGTSTLIGTAIAIVGVLLAVLAFAANRFDAGMSVTGGVETVIAEQRSRDDAQDKKLTEILDRLPATQGNATAAP